MACVRQGFSAGIGNWVADEVLYQARIHPEQKASTLSTEQASALHEQMQAVLRARRLPQHTHVHTCCFHYQQCTSGCAFVMSFSLCMPPLRS